MHAKPVLGKDLHELEGNFLLDPDDLPGGGSGGGASESGGGGGDMGGDRVFYGDPDSGGSEVSFDGVIIRSQYGRYLE